MFFLKATLWPDFKELFFWVFWVKTGDLYLTSAKKRHGFLDTFKCWKWWFLSRLVTLSDQLTKAQKFLWYLTSSLENWLIWHNINVLTLISFDLTPRLPKLVRFQVRSSKTRFTTTSSYFGEIDFILSRCYSKIAENRIENKTSEIFLANSLFINKN